MQRLEGRVEALTIVIQGQDPRSRSETPHAMRPLFPGLRVKHTDFGTLTST